MNLRITVKYEGRPEDAIDEVAKILAPLLRKTKRYIDQERYEALTEKYETDEWAKIGKKSGLSFDEKGLFETETNLSGKIDDFEIERVIDDPTVTFAIVDADGWHAPAKITSDGNTYDRTINDIEWEHVFRRYVTNKTVNTVFVLVKCEV